MNKAYQQFFLKYFQKFNVKHFLFPADNPLICSCELIWFPNLLQDLKNRDDEMTQKKRPMCTMANEHREYFVQNMPLERMNCIGKNLGRAGLSGSGQIVIVNLFLIFSMIGTLIIF